MQHPEIDELGLEALENSQVWGEMLHADVELRMGHPGIRHAVSVFESEQVVHQSWWEDWRRRFQRRPQGEGGGQPEDKERIALVGEGEGDWHPEMRHPGAEARRSESWR